MELRKDYVLDRWVIIATDRMKRPKQFRKKSEKGKKELCFFCPGNEHLTPPEIGRISKGKSWKFRWFPNKFPAVKKEGNPEIQTHNGFFTFASAYGYHEIIAETPDHEEQLWDLPKERLTELLKIYNQRIEQLSKREAIRYVVVFKNHGKDAGTSLIHSHTQIAGINFLPEIIKKKCRHSKNECPYCRIIDIEKNSYRACFENNNFVAFAPYASRFSFEIWVFSKSHKRRMDEFSEEEYADLADIMKKILNKLKKINVSYNYYLHYSPSNENLHFHVEVTPRLATWAGFEFSTEAIINSMPPEDAAKFYRGEIIPEK
ncbi:galactose-1-phosphate uridylyltransferase [Candidatus Woesearchaeota archaeon]|nr:galactose-1-phosphate uridylyltransferase [Candidatus Woesearchaeota archaeon]